MTIPNTAADQFDATYFVPDEKLVVYFATSKFDAVQRSFVLGKPNVQEPNGLVNFYNDLIDEADNDLCK